MSVTIKQLPPALDESGAPVVDENGQPVFDTAVNVLPREPRRYREVTQFSLFGNQYVLGATDRDFILAI
ncbi:MAG: hypothetical protein KDE29_11435, partial [Anaerolineales bacterium]|nr:hypothetical protein [Anaerolineales bacterium]